MPAQGQGVPFEMWQVFSSRPYAGCPLAVVVEDGRLSVREMRLIAREFRGMETVFAGPPALTEHTARLRFFDASKELNFAGHGLMGAAVAFGARGEAFGQSVGAAPVFELLAGPLACSLANHGDARQAGFVSRAPLEQFGTLPPAVVAAAIGCAEEDIADAPHPPLMASKGLPFVFVALRSAEALAAAEPKPEAFAEAAKRLPNASGFFAIAPYLRVNGRRVEMRIFAPLSGVAEMPSSASAALALGALLADQEGPQALSMIQGNALGRPCALAVEARVTPQGSWARVSGAAARLMRGEVERPGPAG